MLLPRRPMLPRYFVNLISALILPSRFFPFKAWLYGLAGVKVGNNVRINSEVRIYGNGQISLGSNTWLGIGSEFVVPPSAKVVIGSNCDIAPRVRFLCGTHVLGGPERRAGSGLVLDIHIGSGVWIGAGAMFLPGAYLEDGIVVAAGAVVIRGRYPANALLAGNPAKIKKYYE